MKTKIVLACALLVAASGAVGAVAPISAPAVKPMSAALATKGFALLAGKQANAATDQFETALAVDPMNRRAYVGLAEAAKAQGLPGKAVRYYREALALEPNDLDALSGRAEALAARGATARAGIDLARIRTLCGKGACPAAQRVESAIAAATAAGATRTAANLPAPAPISPKSTNK